jgi:hypothetical protein
MDHVKTLGFAPLLSTCVFLLRCHLNLWKSYALYLEERFFVITSAGVLDDGIPALRLYIKRGDRTGITIPTTANSKAIIKQVKRAIQVFWKKTSISRFDSATPSLSLSIISGRILLAKRIAASSRASK